MYEIIPKAGIGPLRFGMKIDTVKSIMGEELVYEDWMNGNLNDSLYYSGIIIGMRPYDTYGPLENSEIVEFRVNENFPALLYGKELFKLTGSQLIELLKEQGFKPYQTQPFFVSCDEIAIHFDLDEDNNYKVCHVEM